MNLFTELTEKQQKIIKERNLALDFLEGIHPENSKLINALEKYIASKTEQP